MPNVNNNNVPVPTPRQSKPPVPAPRIKSAIIPADEPPSDDLYVNNVEERRREEENSVPRAEIYSSSDLYMEMSSSKCPEVIFNKSAPESIDLPLPPLTVLDGSQLIFPSTEFKVSSAHVEDSSTAPFPLPDKRRSRLKSCDRRQLEITKELNKRFQLREETEDEKVHEYFDIENQSFVQRNEEESKQENLNYDETDDVFQDEPPEAPLRCHHPREDMSRIKTAIIFSDSPNFNFHTLPPTPTRSISLTDTKSPKTVTSKILKKLGKSLSSDNFKQKSKSGSSNGELFSKRPNFIGDLDSSVKHAGMLRLANKGEEEFRVLINNGYITWKGERGEKSINIMEVTSITAVNESSDLQVSSFGFEVCHVVGSATEARVRSFSCRSRPERDTWLCTLLGAATAAFPASLAHNLTRAGWLHVKEGLGGAWVPCWMMLRERQIFYCVRAGTVLSADLRKARRIGETVSQSCSGVEEHSVSVLVDGGRSLYLQAPSERDTNRWGLCIRTAAITSGDTLEQQQLTRDDVPVIVDKCANFVAANGCASEGIYRRSDSGVAASALLAEFRADAWSVQLTPVHSEHVVAAVFKAFFAQLAEPLIPSRLQPDFRGVAKDACSDVDEKVARYRTLLQEMPPAHYVVSRRLFGHLHFLHLQCAKNKMGARCLAGVWGASLLHQPAESLVQSQTSVLEDLIVMYPRLYNVAEDEMLRELRMLRAVEDINTRVQQKSSETVDDMMVWVHIGQYDSTHTVPVALSPHTTAVEVCTELGRGSDYMLQEFVLGGALARPLQPKEGVLSTVLRWENWDDEDRRRNQLVLAPCGFYTDVMSVQMPRREMSAELKFADVSSKTFKVFEFEVNQSKLSFYKDKKSTSRLGEWKVDEIVWYLGFEPKRDPNAKWSITFISKDKKTKRSKEQPFFGCTLGGSSKEELLNWAATLYLASYFSGV